MTLPDDSQIEVVVVRVVGNKVQLGYSAAKNICIDREVVYLDKRRAVASV